MAVVAHKDRNRLVAEVRIHRVLLGSFDLMGVKMLVPIEKLVRAALVDEAGLTGGLQRF